MYILDKLKTQLADGINLVLERLVVEASDFVTPPDAKMGDLCLPCFKLAKELGKNPGEIAIEISDILPENDLIATLYPAGPYLNIVFSEKLIEAVLKEISTSKNYGARTDGHKKRVMLEYANQNTHKELHVGHLRNFVHGDAIIRILAANGYVTIPVSYINDFGIHTAKTLWYYLKTKAKEPKNNKGAFLGQLYAAGSQALAADEAAKPEVGRIMREIESRKGEMFKLWKKTRQWSIAQFAEAYKELGVKFATTFYESDFVQEGFKIVEKLVAKGILKKSQGAIIADLEEYNLGVLVVVRSDGTGLYPVADLSLTMHKVKKYKLGTSLWMIDVRQAQYLNQLFKVLELAGLKAHLAHLPYEFVKLPGGMMSSRSGNVVTYDELKTEALKKTAEEIKKRHKDWNKAKIEKTARVIAFGALKFEMVKVNGDKVITFDIGNALRFDGYTAAYLQYTYARIQSIRRKAPRSLKAVKTDLKLLTEEREKKLAISLALFPAAIQEAARDYQPADIAKYLFELCQLFNDYYHGVPILNDDTLDKKLIAARLQLSESVAFVIKRGLGLLGIETIEEM